MVDVAGLHGLEWGSGDRLALLLHGQLASAEAWWAVGPQLAEHGYRVLAIDLPGHGRSKHDSVATLESVTLQLLQVCPSAAVAIGHSLGGLLLSHCADLLTVDRAIFVDTPLSYRPRATTSEMRKNLERAKTLRTHAWLAANRPLWAEVDREVEARAAQQFDVETSVSLMATLAGCGVGSDRVARTMAVVPEPSNFVSASDLDTLIDGGVEVRRLANAGHTAWYGNVDAFMAAIGDWL